MLKTLIRTTKYDGIDPDQVAQSYVQILTVAAIAMIHGTPEKYQGINYWNFVLAFTRAHSPDQVPQVMTAIPEKIKAKVLAVDEKVQQYFGHADYDVLAAYQVAFGTLENAMLVAVSSGNMKMKAAWLHAYGERAAATLMETYAMVTALRQIDKDEFGITAQQIAGTIGTAVAKPSLTLAVLIQHEGVLDVATYTAVLRAKLQNVSANGGITLTALGIHPDVPAVESFVGNLGRPANVAFGSTQEAAHA